MGFRDRGRRTRKSNDDKYLRLTGLWPSKNNESLWTGRLKDEQIEGIIKQAEEALEAGAPLVISLWENTKKKSRKDPDFSVQSFVGDADDQPKSRRASRDTDDEDGDADDNDQDEETTDEEEEQPRRKAKDKVEKKSSRRASKDDKW